MTTGGTKDGAQRSSESWLADLSADGPAAEAAQRDLRVLVAGAVRKATSGHGRLDDATYDDLTQVATMRVLDTLGRFEGRSKFTTWAYSVAVRAAFSELRKASYRTAGEELTEANSGALTDTAPAPLGTAERKEIVEVMHRVIADELTERQRTAILGELNGTPQQELLVTLGVNRNALYKLVHDARSKLRDGLQTAGIRDHQVREAFDL